MARSPSFCAARLVLGMVLTALAGPLGLAADPATDPENDPHFKYLVQRLKALTLKVDDSVGEMQSKPLFRWQNPVSGANGAVFLWTHQGRPAMISKTHVNDQKQHYVESMTPLTTKPLVLRRDSTVSWSPATTDVKRRSLTDVEPPAGNNGLRLTQMRAIARRYRFTSLWGEENRSEWELRLLSTPLHRCSNADAGIIDGAIFGYAQGTNPEAAVIIEAVTTNQQPVWEAYPVRLSGYSIKGWLDEELVFDVPYLNGTRWNMPFHHYYERPNPYPFPDKTPATP